MELRIKQIMKKKGVTSVELARELGMSKPTISYMINGKTMPSLVTLEKVATILGVPIGHLFDAPQKELNEAEPQLTCPHCGRKIHITLSE